MAATVGMSGQLSLELDGPVENPNAHMFTADGRPRRLMWCSDDARLGGPCPYKGAKGKYRPAGGCCKKLIKAKEKP